MPLLGGKRALVVGAGSGIGRAVAEAYVDEGAVVVGMELNPAKCVALRAEVNVVAALEGDATSSASVAQVVAEAVAALGGLDVLVNCVGLFDFYTGLRDFSDQPGQLDDAFDEAFTANVKSQLLPAKAALSELERTRGSIESDRLNIELLPGRGGVLYVASKFAVRGVVIALAHELAPTIRVNAVAPGGTLGTDLRGLRSLGMHQRSLGQAPDRAADLRRNTPLEIALTPADIAASYVFLASDMALGMTGEFLHPDGGAGIKR